MPPIRRQRRSLFFIFLAIFLVVFAESHFLSDRETVVGVYFPRVGSASPTAEIFQKSVLWAIDYFNGRDRRKRVRPVISHNPLPEEAVKELADQGATVIFAGATSGQTKQILPHCSSRQIPLISPASSASDLAIAGDLLFRGLHDSYQPGRLAGKIALEEGLSGYIVVTVSDNEGYGQSFLHGFSESVGMNPLLSLVVQGSLPLSSISRLIDETRSFDTAVLILPDRWACRVARQLRLAFPGIRICLADWGSSPNLAYPGSSMLEGVRQTGYFAVNLSDLGHPYIDFVNRCYGRNWDPFSVDLSFRAVSLFMAAIDRDKETGEGICKALASVREIEGLYGTLAVNAMGDIVTPLKIAHVEKGEWVEGP